MEKISLRAEDDARRTYVTFVLDETGSMESVRDDTIGGFNAYVDSLRRIPGEVRLSLIQFDSNRVRKVHVDAPVERVERMTRETYRPGASTPLYDAIVLSVRATEDLVRGRDVKVLVVIQTDGQENASREFNLRDVQDVVRKKTEAGWEFVFLGCGIDAYADAGRLGIRRGVTMSYGRTMTESSFGALANATGRLVASGSVEFTEQEKLAAGDEWGAGPAAPRSA